MFQHSYRGTLVWLLIVGMALGLMMLAGGVPVGVGAGLVAAYMALVLLVVRNVPLGSLLGILPARGGTQQGPTEIAREATARARSLPDYDILISLLDVGLIVDEQRPDGMSLRRGRFISLDDDAIRPFAIVRVPESLGERLSHVRFELRDGADQLQYVYEDDKWLQTGENILLTDYRFPIRKRAAGLESGGWEARVIVDGGVLGVHHFNLSPSLRTHRQHMGSDGEILRERVWQTSAEDESLPLSLEELIRQQSRQQHQE